MTIEKLVQHPRIHPGLQELRYSEANKIRKLLVGRKVVEVDGDQAKLDNGTIVRVLPNDGGCSCGAGDYELKALNRVDNVITKVEFEDAAGNYDAHTYRIFVYADNEKINLLTVEGDDGSGWYGTGYELLVKPYVHEGRAAA